MALAQLEQYAVQLSAPAGLRPALQDRFDQVSDRLADAAVDLPPELAASAAEVGIASDFVLSVLAREPAALIERLLDRTTLTIDTLRARLDLGAMAEPAAMAVLRGVRQVEMARIAWRDIPGWSDLETSLNELSTLADGMIQLALAYAA